MTPLAPRISLLRERGSIVAEDGASAENLVAAFRRLRSHWRGLFESPPKVGTDRRPDDAATDSPEGRESMIREVGEDLSVVTTAARVSVEAAAFVETAFRARMGDFGAGEKETGGSLSPALAEAARSLRGAFQALTRTLQQMESGDDILPEMAREMRRSAARAVAFFHELRDLDDEEQEEGDGGGPADAETRPPESRDAAMERLAQSYDGRRKMVREDVELPPPAVEAVEFFLRLGAG